MKINYMNKFIVSLIWYVGIFCLFNITVSATDYYVSNSGDDNNDGLSISAPLRTIQKAAIKMTKGDTCYIRGGTYGETVTPPNSGEANSKITFTNYNGEDVTINGCNPVNTLWTQHSGNIYKTTVTLELNKCNQVFVNGEMNDLARWPNNTGTLMEPTFAVADAGSLGSITDFGLPSKSNGYWNGATVLCFTGYGWGSEQANVTGYNEATKKLTIGNTIYAPKKDNKYYLTNILGALDTEKEWYYDSTNTTLYLYKQGGGNPGTSVEVKKRNYGFVLDGRSYIDVKGIKLFATGISTSNTTSYCTISEITASYLKHGPASDAVGGILLYGTGQTLKNSTLKYSSGAIVKVNGTNNNIINNDISYADYDGGWESSINIAGGKGHLISNNSVYEAGRSCISMSSGAITTDIVIQYNDMYNAGRQTYDLGVMYFANVDAQNFRIHHNKVHINSGSIVDTRGIYLDNFTTNFIVDHNVVWNCVKGISLNTPSNGNLVYNNTIVNSATLDINYYGFADQGKAYTEDMFGNKIFNNIFTNAISVPLETSIGYNLGADQDPQFFNSSTKDYHLTGTSPAVNAGIVVPGITDGYQGSNPDMGAYEYGGANWVAGCNLAAPPNVTAERVNTTYRNLVVNGGMETGLDNWTKTDAKYAINSYGSAWNAGAATPTLNARAHYYGVRLGSTTVGSADGITQTVTGLLPNTTYILSAWVRGSTSETIEIGATGFGDTTSISCTSPTWIQRTCEFTTGSNNTTANIYVRKTSLGRNYVYADVVGLYVKEPLKASVGPLGTIDISSTLNKLEYNSTFPNTSQINIIRVNADATQQNLTGYSSTSIPSITYASSNTNVISITPTGLMTGNMPGISVITVTVTENGIATSKTMIAYVYKYVNQETNFSSVTGAYGGLARSGYYSWSTDSSDSSKLKYIYTGWGRPSVHTGLVEFWFYDDPSDLTIKHYVEVIGNASVSLRLTFSDYLNTYKYSIIKPTSVAATYYTTATRTKGWHQVLIHFPTSNVLSCYIDGTLVNTFNAEHIGMLSDSYIKLNASGNKAYYDDVRHYQLSDMGTSIPIFTKTVNSVETDITSTGLVAGTINGKITVANYDTANVKPAILLMALYENIGGVQKLIGLTTSALTSVTATSDNTKEPVLTTSMNVSTVTENSYIKLYVWNSTTGLKSVDGKVTNFGVRGIINP